MGHKYNKIKILTRNFCNYTERLALHRNTAATKCYHVDCKFGYSYLMTDLHIFTQPGAAKSRKPLPIDTKWKSSSLPETFLHQCSTEKLLNADGLINSNDVHKIKVQIGLTGLLRSSVEGLCITEQEEDRRGELLQNFIPGKAIGIGKTTTNTWKF